MNLMTMDAPVPSPGKEASSFEETMIPHLNAAYNLARWLLRHDADAEDAVQDAYLRAYRAFAGFRGGNGRSWILTIVRNVCYSRLRRTLREPPADPFDENLHGAARGPADVSATLWSEARRELLQQALEGLPVEFREVIVLHEIEGLAYKEIAAVMEIPIGTVMSRLARARLKLQDAVLLLSRKEAIRGM